MTVVIRLYKIEGSTLATGRKNLAAKAVVEALTNNDPFIPFNLGPYVKAYDPDAHAGLGEAFFTNHKTKAKRFPTIVEATEFWRQQSKVKPLREDGKPNRPLTAYNIMFEKMEE